jgi:hypothetical protein
MSPLAEDILGLAEAMAKMNTRLKDIESRGLQVRGAGRIPFATRVVSPISASPSIAQDATSPGAGKLLQWIQAFHVATTNNGTNFWTVGLYKQDGVGAGVLVDSFTTAAYAPDTWLTETRSLTHSLAVGIDRLYLQVTSTLAPGAISIACPALFWVAA